MKIEFHNTLDDYTHKSQLMVYFSGSERNNGEWNLCNLLAQKVESAHYLRPIILREWLKQGKQLDIKWLQRK